MDPNPSRAPIGNRAGLSSTWEHCGPDNGYIGPIAPSASTLPATLVNHWLRPVAVVGSLALRRAAFNGMRQEVHSVRQDTRTTEASLRSDFKADLQAVETRLRDDISELKAD